MLDFLFYTFIGFRDLNEFLGFCGLVAWVLCGFVAAGRLYAVYQDIDPLGADRGRVLDTFVACLVGLLLGPIALVVCTLLFGFIPWSWRIPGERRDA